MFQMEVAVNVVNINNLYYLIIQQGKTLRGRIQPLYIIFIMFIML